MYRKMLTLYTTRLTDIKETSTEALFIFSDISLVSFHICHVKHFGPLGLGSGLILAFCSLFVNIEGSAYLKDPKSKLQMKC